MSTVSQRSVTAPQRQMENLVDALRLVLTLGQINFPLGHLLSSVELVYCRIIKKLPRLIIISHLELVLKTAKTIFEH